MNSVYRNVFFLGLLFFICSCSGNENKTPVAPGQRTYLPVVGFIKGPVIKIEEGEDPELEKFYETIYTIDYTSGLLTKSSRETKIKEVYYLNKEYRADSLVSEDKSGTHTTVYYHVPVYDELEYYHKHNNKITDSLPYTVDSTDKSNRQISYVSAVNPDWHITRYYNREGLCSQSITTLLGSGNTLKTTYTYDGSGNLSKVIQGGPNGSSVREYEYRYDEKGNWTEMEIIDNDSNGKKINASYRIRKITYSR